MANEIRTLPVAVNWSVYAGDRNRQLFELYATDDTVWDLSGCTFKAQARTDTTDPVIAIEATCTVEDAVNGILAVAWDGELVRTLLAGTETWSGEWDLEVLEPVDPLPVTLMAGKFDAHMDVTKA